MTKTMHAALRAALAASTMLTVTAVAAPAFAQTTTASVRGQVSDASGAPAAGATVTAVSAATNQTLRVVTGSNGAYVLNGLRPGQYNISVTAANGETFEQVVTVGVGQSATLDARLEAAGAGGDVDAGSTTASNNAGDIVVTGNKLIETKTSEVATNVSQQQIRDLPQTDRNFLSFAALAPGVRFNDGESNKGITSGASVAAQVNVFIDGVSLKNNVLDGGIAGQQDSRGNPFGQLAVGEFRVLTQNYKAEYEQAGAAIVSAVTKSGTNQFHGEAFGQYTGKELSSTSIFTKVANLQKPDFKRKQYGVSLGGPIIKDKLFFFAAYEGNDQDRALTVRLGDRSAANLARFGQYEGQFVSPFRGDFYFGKLTLTPDARSVFDLSVSKRQETDVQGFGGSTFYAYTAAQNRKNTVDTYDYKWTYTGDTFVNQFDANYLNYVYNPTSLSPNQPTFTYQGVITIGGKESTQKISQASYTLRDDFTYNGLTGHVIKTGIKFAFQDYDFEKDFFVQPQFTFINDATRGLDFSFPANATVGLGNPRIIAHNSQLGLYVQDDWDVTNTLQLNLGLRWDYESNLFNNGYITPPNAAALLRALPQTYYFKASDYITDGSNRPPFLKAFQPRAGFSWDIKDDQSTVVFGGYGRYYDRNVFNNTLDERFRLQYAYGNFNFSRTGGLDVNGNPTVAWNDSYYNRDNLLALRASAVTGLPELFAVKNNAEPPKTDQFSFGVRHKFGIFQASVTGSYIRGTNGYTHLFGTRQNAGLGGCCDTALARSYGYANVLLGYDGLDTRYKALYVTLDKFYTESSGWGFNLAYTLSKGEQNGNDLFSLDKITPDAYGFRDRPGDERHRVVISGIVDLPLGVKFSTLTTLGSGQAFTLTDATQGSGLNQINFRALHPPKNCIGGVFAYCEVNLTLQKELPIFGKDHLTFAVDLFNAFDNKNFTGYPGYIGTTASGAPRAYEFDNTLKKVSTDGTLYAQPNDLLTLPRRVQFRVGYRF